MIQRDLRKELVHDDLKPIGSTLGQKQTFTRIIPERPVPGVKQPFETVGIGTDFDVAL